MLVGFRNILSRKQPVYPVVETQLRERSSFESGRVSAQLFCVLSGHKFRKPYTRRPIEIVPSAAGVRTLAPVAMPIALAWVRRLWVTSAPPKQNVAELRRSFRNLPRNTWRPKANYVPTLPRGKVVTKTEQRQRGKLTCPSETECEAPAPPRKRSSDLDGRQFR